MSPSPSPYHSPPTTVPDSGSPKEKNFVQHSIDHKVSRTTHETLHKLHQHGSHTASPTVPLPQFSQQRPLSLSPMRLVPVSGLMNPSFGGNINACFSPQIPNQGNFYNQELNSRSISPSTRSEYPLPNGGSPDVNFNEKTNNHYPVSPVYAYHPHPAQYNIKDYPSPYSTYQPTPLHMPMIYSPVFNNGNGWIDAAHTPSPPIQPMMMQTRAHMQSPTLAGYYSTQGHYGIDSSVLINQPGTNNGFYKAKYTLWTKEEDNLLIEYRRNQLLSWKAIAAKFPNRTTHACQFRWKKINISKEAEAEEKEKEREREEAQAQQLKETEGESTKGKDDKQLEVKKSLKRSRSDTESENENEKGESDDKKREQPKRMRSDVEILNC